MRYRPPWGPPGDNAQHRQGHMHTCTCTHKHPSTQHAHLLAQQATITSILNRHTSHQGLLTTFSLALHTDYPRVLILALISNYNAHIKYLITIYNTRNLIKDRTEHFPWIFTLVSEKARLGLSQAAGTNTVKKMTHKCSGEKPTGIHPAQHLWKT